jgi:hypothetical protein
MVNLATKGFTMSNARFFYSVPSSTQSGSSGYVMVSPGHYGSSIAGAIKLAEALRIKLRSAGIKFTDKGSEAAQIEFGNTDWDKGVMRVKLSISLEMTLEEATDALSKAGFCPGLPT